MSKPVSAYYKYPDGEDIIGKLWHCNRVTGILGLGVSFLDVQLYNKPKGYLGALGRIAYWTGPALGVSTAFVCTTYIATNLRKKDDSLNYALGGIASGCVLGAFRRSFAVGAFSGIFLAAVAAIKKEAVNEGYVFFPEIHYEHQNLGSRNFDFTLTSELPGNWTSENQ